MLKQLNLKNPTLFLNGHQLPFVAGLNVFVIENGTDKTNLMKAVYSLIATSEKASRKQRKKLEKLVAMEILRVLVRKLLALFNLRLVEIPLTEQILNSLQMQKKVKFLQIGANDGISFDCLYDYVTQHQWDGVVVEPLEDFYESLCNNYKNYPSVKPIKYAINSNQTEMSLFKLNPNYYNYYPDWAKGIASFSQEHLVKHDIDAQHILIEKVNCISLMRLIEKFKLEDIDYLQIDTEGFDAEVIKMIDFNVVAPKIIKYEIKHLSNKQRGEVEQILVSQNYRLKSDYSDGFAIRKS